MRKRVLVELKYYDLDALKKMFPSLEKIGLSIDKSYEPIPSPEHTFYVRGEIEEEKIRDLEASLRGVKVWLDSKIEEFKKKNSSNENFTALF